MSLRVVTLFLVLSAAVGLTFVFWLPLWTGGGLVGGDVYSYYLPQKVFYAEELAAGRLPLWNNLVGHGYPVLGESQTGALYPPHLLAYRALDVNTAYNAIHIGHYVLAFVLTWLYARRFGLGRVAAGMTGLVYVYSWFPSRACWEWAIIGGTWLPAALLCVESVIQCAGRGIAIDDSESMISSRTGWKPVLRAAEPWAMLLSAVLGVQMLAGHYNIAFITLVTIVAYAVLRTVLGAGRADSHQPDAQARAAVAKQPPSPAIPSRADGVVQPPSLARRAGVDGLKARGVLLLVAGPILLAFGLAAVQLLPTWELRQHSQRAEVGGEHNPARGAIPYWYLTQTVRPWHWFRPAPLIDRDAELRESPPAGGPTNQVEAHLYFGLAPLALALWSAVVAVRRRDRRLLVWLMLGAVAMVYSTGVLVPWFSQLPGFSFFIGPGRWGVLATLAVAVAAGYAVDELVKKPSAILVLIGVAGAAAAGAGSLALSSDVDFVVERFRTPNPLETGLFFVDSTHTMIAFIATSVLGAAAVVGSVSSRRARVNATHRGGPFWYAVLTACVVIFSTIVDLWIVGRIVTYSVMVESPPIARLENSPVRKLLRESEAPVRLNGPGPNFPTVLGVAATPVYLPFGPAEYINPKLTMPAGSIGKSDDGSARFKAEQVAWMRQAGVTHVLSFSPVETSDDPAEDASDPPLRLLWTGADPVLNPGWARPNSEPLYLYQLSGGRGRASREADGVQEARESATRVVELRPGFVEIETAGDRTSRLVLTDLLDPGWNVELDGEPALPIRVDGMFRGVDVPAGRHTVKWRYRPQNVWIGAIVSGISVLLLIGTCVRLVTSRRTNV